MTKIVTKQSRQGDVLITQEPMPKKVSAIPSEHGRVVLAHGEHTGHHHSFADRAALFRDDGRGNGMYLSVDAPASLEHQEHSAITHAPGSYRVRRQRQFQSGMAARVED